MNDNIYEIPNLAGITIKKINNGNTKYRYVGKD